jgi:ABC-type nickel/cobalt efflux system permease component RcnA
MTQIAAIRDWRWLPAIPGMQAGHAGAAPIEGEVSSNAAVLLMLLGLWALFMGLRNLRELRHKRLIPDRRHPSATEPDHH